VRIQRERGQLIDVHDAVGEVILPAQLELVIDEPVHNAGAILVDGDSHRRQLALGLVAAGDHQPQVVLAAQDAARAIHLPGFDVTPDGDCFVQRVEANPAGVGERNAQSCVRGVDLRPADVTGHAIPEPAIDRALRRAQPEDGDAALTSALQ
jgi:hypothetical protein